MGDPAIAVATAWTTTTPPVRDLREQGAVSPALGEKTEIVL